jgi:hypothetical protein
MGGRARSRNPRTIKHAEIVGQAHRLPFLAGGNRERLPYNLFHRDWFLRFLCEFFETRIAAQRIPEWMQPEFAVA